MPRGRCFKLDGGDEEPGSKFVGATFLALVKVTVSGWGVSVGCVAEFVGEDAFVLADGLAPPCADDASVVVVPAGWPAGVATQLHTHALG